MLLYKSFRKKVGNFIRKAKETNSKTAYNLWASEYDDQPENLIVYLNKIILDKMIDSVNFEDKTVIDFGCGTGKHWEKLYAKNPAKLIGYDISQGMLDKLREKYPPAITYCLDNNKLSNEKNNSCDIIISSLVIAHIKDIQTLFIEWDRVLKNNATIIFTDFHPDALQSGATRQFGYNGKSIVIRNYIHSLHKIREIAKALHWKEIETVEKEVDNSVKSFYRTPDALKVFEETYGTKLLYAMQFKKFRSSECSAGHSEA